jgi:hypothetical protein
MEIVVAQLVQGSNAVFCLVGIGIAALLEQIADDAAHGGKIVHHQKLELIGHMAPFLWRVVQNARVCLNS